MAIALKLNASTGQLSRLATSDSLEVQSLEPRNTGAALLIGATLDSGQEVQIGNTNADTRILGDLLVDGGSTISVNETIEGNLDVEGNTNLGVDGSDTINLGTAGTGVGTDTINLNSDLVVGAGLSTIGSSVTDFLDGLWMDAVNGNGPALAAYDLNASGTNAGAYAIGVDPSLIANSTATDLMTMLDDLDAAIAGGGGNNLQAAYALAPGIAVTAGNGAIAFSNSVTADTTTVLSIARAPGVATAGLGLDIALGANASGTALRSITAGSGLAAQFGSGGNTLDVRGNSILGSADLTLTATGELTLASNETSATSTTLSQDGDRSYDLTGAGEVLSGATSLVGAINRLANQTVSGEGAQESIVIENTVVLVAGEVVAQSTVTGRITQGDMNADTNSRIVGIALTGGTGDVGGTVEALVAYPGGKVTISGASFTPGAALFAPDGTGEPTETPPAAVGDVVMRVGWAHSATEFVVDLGPAVIL